MSHVRQSKILRGYSQASKPLMGIQVGAKRRLRLIEVDGNLMLDNFHGSHCSIKIGTIPAPFTKARNSPLAYCAPMRPVGPRKYIPKIIDSEQVVSIKQQLNSSYIENILSSNKFNNGIPTMQEHLLKMVQYLEDRTLVQDDWSVSKSDMQDYLDHLKHIAAVEPFALSLEAFSKAQHTYGPNLRNYCCFILSEILDVLDFSGNLNNLENLVKNTSIAQRKGIQFFLNIDDKKLRKLYRIQLLINSAHLFHSLNPGSAFGIIKLAKGKLRFAPCHNHLICQCKSLPSDLNNIIIDYLLLGERNSRVTQLFVKQQRYYRDNPTETPMMRSMIIKTLL